MGKNTRTIALWAASLLICMGLAACSASQKTFRSLSTATGSTTAIHTAAGITDVPRSPIPSIVSSPSATWQHTVYPQPSATQIPLRASTSTPIPPTPSPLPPTFTPTALACLRQPGRIETGALTPESLANPLEYHIYLPPCYDEQPERRYPVLYLIHGLGYTDDQWVRLGVPTNCDALIAEGEVAPFLVVMPRDQVWKRPSKDMFGQALIEVLIPWVETQYRTLPERQYRAIGGLSRGAAWAVHLGLIQWELFGTIGAHSLPVFLEDEPDIAQWIEQIPIESFPRLYLDTADHDSPEVLESAFWFEEILIEKGIPHEWHLFPGEHKETYWQAHIEQYLRWYAAEW